MPSWPRRQTEMGRSWAPEPEPEQIHALVGDLITAARLYGGGMKRQLSKKGYHTYRLIPDSYVAIETDAENNLAYEVHESITGRLGHVSLRHWNLVMSEMSTRRGVAYSSRPVDVFSVQEVTAGRAYGLFESDPAVEEFGIRTNYFFEWDNKNVIRAERSVRVTPEERLAGQQMPTVASMLQSIDDGSADYETDLGILCRQDDIGQVSAPDVTYLRERINAHCGKLVNPWDDTVKND